MHTLSTTVIYKKCSLWVDEQGQARYKANIISELLPPVTFFSFIRVDLSYNYSAYTYEEI